MTKYSVSLLWVAAVGILAGCGDSMPTTPTTPTTTVSTAASLQISAVPMTVKTDNSDTATIRVSAVSSSNAAVPNETISLSADTGLLSAQTVTTDSTGIATATFSAGNSSRANRTATITATAGAVTALLPVQIVGSTLTVTSTSTSLIANGALPATLTITALDAGNLAISGAAVTLTQSGTGSVTLTPTSGTTDANGKLVVSVAGATAGTVTVSVNGVGATASANFTIAASVATTFGISQLTLTPPGTITVPANPKTSAMQIGDALAVKVNAPSSTSVIFATTVGTWAGASAACLEGSGKSFCTIPVVGGVATANLGSSVAGVASVSVSDAVNSALSDSLSVGITAKTPAYITLQGTPTVISKSVGGTAGFANLTAMVYDANDAPVGNARVAFSIVSGTGTNSGETVSPVVVISAATTANGLDLGAAPATFTSGSLPSGAQGVQVRASVVGTTISTQSLQVPNATRSSFDAAIHIGGMAGSVAFGQAARINDAGQTSTIYSYPMSVLVADSNGSPAPMGTVVNISAWPIAWTTGSRGIGCDPDPDGYVWGVLTNPTRGGYVPGNGGTFYNEDSNENLILDPLEDGTRKFYYSSFPQRTGTKDSQITPLNSWGGTVVSTNPADPPGTASTDATGLATFNLTFTKSSAFFVITRIRAQTTVQGTPAVGQLEVPFGPSDADWDPITGKCYLPPSPFAF